MNHFGEFTPMVTARDVDMPSKHLFVEDNR
jgi:hypothetical protein